MKKLIGIAMVLSMVFFLGGCAKKEVKRTPEDVKKDADKLQRELR